MNRQTARELAATTLNGLSRFMAVYKGPRRSFGGISPVAIVLSKSLAIIDLTRDLHDQVNLGLTATIYVRADVGGEDAAEDTLDQLTDASADALRDVGFLVGESDAAPDGAPLRNIDGVFYRVERLPLLREEYD